MNPDTTVLPGLEIMVDRTPRWKFPWQQAPLAACPQQIEDGIDDATKVGGARTPAWPRRRQNRCDPGPSRRQSGRYCRIGRSSYRTRVADERSFKTDVNFSNTL